MKRVRYEPRRPGQAMALDPKAVHFLFDAKDIRETDLLSGGVAVVYIDGPLEQKRSFMWDSYQDILERFTDAVQDHDVQSVVIKIDSPGGDCAGLNECVRAMRLEKEHCGKPVYVYCDEVAASAAYALATVADEIYLPEEGGVGSIGVIATMYETTARDTKEGLHFEVIASGARKPDGNPHIPISEGSRKRLTERVNTLADGFFEMVAEARGLSAAVVQAFQADVFYGADAVRRGLADGVMSWADVIDMAHAGTTPIDNGDESASLSNTTPGARAPTKRHTMAHLALRKAKKDAEAALASAKTAAARKSALAAYTEATGKLATAEAQDEARKLAAAAAEDAEDAEDEDMADDESDDDGDGPDDDGDGDEDAEDAEDEKYEEDGKKAASGLVPFLSRVTGKKSIAGIKGAVQALVRNSEKIARIEGELRTAKVSALVSAGLKAGKIAPKQRDYFTKMGMQSPAMLKGYLDTAAAMVRGEDDALAPGIVGPGGGVSLTEDQAKIAAVFGMEPDKLAAKVAEKNNGAGRRH